jgi:molybdate transport system substrate-binding protein
MPTPTVPLTLLSSMAVRNVLAELAAGFERVAMRAVRAEAAGGVEVARRVRAGERADVVVLAGNVIDQLMGEGLLAAGSRVDLMQSGIALAVRSGAARPAVDTEEAVRSAVLQAAAVSYSTGPSGTYLAGLFERWGIAARIRDRIVVPPPGVPVASLVADGSIELGFQQWSELANVPGVDVLGMLPDSIQNVTVFSGGVPAVSTEAAAALELLRHIASPQVTEIKRRHGMGPA